MWVLQNSKDCDIHFYLIEGQDYTVGRRDCRILILKDSSVSRNHAKLTVRHSDANLSKPYARPLLTFHDSSKFGSLRNGTKLASGDTHLEDGDLIVFGAMNSNEWRVTYEPLIVAFSSLPSAEKKSLKVLTRKLGGHVVPEWSKECTHLIMTQLTVTIKVIGALVTCRHIVTPEFLRKMEEAAVADSGMPDPLNYHPNLAETAINEKDVSFQPNADRQTLFMGKTVVFLTPKQLKQLGQTVELAGGKPVLIDERMTRSEEKLLTDPSTIVMYADPQDQSQIMTQAGQEWAIQVMEILKRSDLRPIPQSEFGLAVLYASTEVHCNPRVAQAGLTLLHPVAAPSLTQDVLASQTQPSGLPRSHSNETRKMSSIRSQQQEKTIDTGPERSSKKRVREEDTAKFSSPSKLPRKETGKPRDPEQPPSTSIVDVIMENAVPIKTKGRDVSNLSLGVGCVGNSASEHPSVSKEKRKTVTLTSNTESNSVNERGLSKQDSPSQKPQNSVAAAAARISSQKHSPEGYAKADATNTAKNVNPASGSDGDILSLSERFDKKKTRSFQDNPSTHQLKKERIAIEDSADGDILSPSERFDKKTRSFQHNPYPHQLKKEHIAIEDSADGDTLSPSERFDKKTRSFQHNPYPHQLKKEHIAIEDSDEGAGRRTLSHDDVIPPSGRRVERARNKDNDRSNQAGPEEQSVKKGQDISEAAGADSEENIIPPSRKMDDKTLKRNKNMNDQKSEVSLAQDSALESKAKKEPSEGATFTQDMLPPSGNDGRGRRTGKRSREDLVAMDTEEASQKKNLTEESSGNKNSKSSRLAEEDYDGTNAATDPEPRPNAASWSLQEIPTGYITAHKNIKCEPSISVDPTLPYNLAIVEQVDLVVRLPRAPTKEKTDAKNFKKFKKASYVGQFSMPHIIGGTDLYHSETRQLAEAKAAMAEEQKTLQKQREEKDLADDLFNWEPRPTKRRR